MTDSIRADRPVVRNTDINSSSKDNDNVDSDSDESFTCEYDSTWEDDIEDDTNATSKTDTRKKKHVSLWSWDGRNTRAAKDMQIYRHDYPDQADPPICQDFHPNLKFYKNEGKSQPDDLSILDFHSKWKGDYSSLERVHTFIQWLFPIREDGMNFQAYKLTKHEIKAFTEDDTAKERLRTSYKLMLDFYGIELVDDQTGDVQRADNWKERFHNLNKHTHNSLRITRILKCLGTLGFEHYQAPLVRFFLKETLENGQLPNMKESVLDYFLFSILDKAQRKELIKEAFIMFQSSQGSGKRKNKFKWCPKRVQKRFQEELNRVETGTNTLDSVNETQPATNSCEQNDSQLEEEKVLGGPDDASLATESLVNKHSDKEDEPSANKGDGEKQQNTEEAGDDMEAKSNISDKQENKGRPDGADLGSQSLESKHSDKVDETSANKGDGEKQHQNTEEAGDGMEAKNNISDKQENKDRPDDSSSGSESLANKHSESDKDDETSANKGDVEEFKTTEVAGDAVEAQISDIQVGQSANKPTTMNDSSASRSNQPLPLNTLKIVGEDTTQCCTNQDESHVVIDETSTVLTTPQDKPDGSPEQGNQGVRTAGSFIEPSTITTESGNTNLSSDCQRGRNQSSSSIDGSGQVNENIVPADLNQENNKDTEKLVDVSVETSKLGVDGSVATPSSTK